MILQDRIREELQKVGMTQARIGREADISDAVLCRWLKGKYKGRTDIMERKLEAWLAGSEKELGVEDRKNDNWIPTPTGENIINTLTHAQAVADVTVIYGGAGLGKTAALRRYAATHPNVWVVTASPATCRVNAILEETAVALGMDNAPSWTSRLYRKIIEKMRETNGLLIIDEAQHLQVNALETVRALHDEAEIGLALVGNEVVFSRLTGGEGVRAANFAQLFSRIGKRTRLTKPLAGDVRAICSAWELNTDEAKILAKIAAKPGALRGVVKTLRLASMLAAGDNCKMASHHLRTAWTDLSC